MEPNQKLNLMCSSNLEGNPQEINYVTTSEVISSSTARHVKFESAVVLEDTFEFRVS